MRKKITSDPKEVLRIAGGFLAWMIGSGFATGQEILQFFSRYGGISYGILLLDLVGFVWVGRILLATGNRHQESGFDHFSYYCGKRLGRFYARLIPLTLLLVIAVMVSGAGSTLSEYFGVDRRLGSALMAAAVVGAYLVGFTKMVRLVSSIGPVIIVFALLVGILSVLHGVSDPLARAQFQDTLRQPTTSPPWFVSAGLYVSMCFFTAGTYYSALGKTARNPAEARLGATIGAAVFILAVAVMNTAILLNGEAIKLQEIPTLYLATNLSRAFAGVFTVCLILAIFSSCSTMMWSVCSRFFSDNPRRNRLFALASGMGILILAQFSFSRLLGFFYPMVGYAGLIYIGGVLWKSIREKGKPGPNP